MIPAGQRGTRKGESPGWKRRGRLTLAALLVHAPVALHAGDATEVRRADGAAPGREAAASRALTFRGSERREVTPTDEIVDGRWIIIGNSEKTGGRVVRDADHPYKGSPVYRFSAASDAVNRIEFSELFGSAERLKGIPEEQVDRLVAIMATDIGVDLGRYGDTVTYEWSTRFPERMGPETLGIFAQWHGRPDRTLVADGQSVRMLALAEFEELTRTVEFREDGWGYDRKSGRKTTYRVDAAAGGPIGEFRVGFDHLYLMVRSDASRRSSSEVKLKAKPTQEAGCRMHDGAKEASLVWKIPLAEVPVNEWMDFKVRIRFSEYDAGADRVLAPGAVTLWMNGIQVADWKGHIGQNDSLGPYFKFGIYKPGPGGFKVDHAAYRRTLERTRRSPDAPNPLKDELMGRGRSGTDRTADDDGVPAAESSADSAPYFLEGQPALYRRAPREAARAWFDEARLGLFVHWGVWGKHHAAWAMFNQRIPLEDYQRTAREVDASGFNAREIVRLAEDSGMRYITFVAKHHDGFCLWDSKVTEWDSMDYPMRRDLVAELAKACRERGMPLFIYYSIGIDWTHPYFIPRELYSVGRPAYARTPAYFQYRKPEDFEKYREFCKRQLVELCTQYGPLAGFWFDPLGGVLANPEMFKMQEFYDLIHHYQPHALIHFKTGATGTEDVLVGERELKSISMHYGNTTPQDRRIRKRADEAWSRNFEKKAEIAVTSQGAWEWGPDRRCQDADALWRMLVDAADHNANLLLNFGPKPDGSIPEDVAANFRLLGSRIRAEGYPALNRATYLERRQKGASVDKTEREKTAR